MTEWILKEWREQRLGVLLVGGQVMVADGLREDTKDLDACLSARQCPRMLAWLEQKEHQGHSIQIRLGSAPLHPEWLGRGWTFHVELDATDRVDFFGVPLRAPHRIANRFFQDPAAIALASLPELGNLKRTERPQDWGDIELIAGRLREQGDSDAMIMHLFGPALVEELHSKRQSESFRRALERSQQAHERPLLRLGLTAPLEELRAMARAEQRFWEVAGALRSDEIIDTARQFWRKHRAAIQSETTFAARHGRLLTAALSNLPKSPIQDPARLIEAARAESGVNRWPGLLPATRELVLQYFPEYRPAIGAQLRGDPIENPTNPPDELEA